jgi:glutamate--cysteine ligase
VGVRNPGGDYNQLGTSLLQIENEFYGTIRPKRTVRTGERPLHALRERGVEYVEVRLMDLDPSPVGITRPPCACWMCSCCTACCPTARPTPRRDCRTQAQPAPDRRARPRARPALRQARLCLDRLGDEVLAACEPLAAALDATHGAPTTAPPARGPRAVQAPERTPSARVLATMARTCQQL